MRRIYMWVVFAKRKQLANEIAAAGRLVDGVSKVASPRFAHQGQLRIQDHDGVAASLIFIAVPSADIPTDVE